MQNVVGVGIYIYIFLKYFGRKITKITL